MTHNLQVSDGDNGLMLLRDQIVIQIGEELDGMVMIRSGDNRQGVCPVKFLQEVWHRSEVACQATYTCNCLKTPTPNTLKKIYYPNPSKIMIQNNVLVSKQNNKKNINAGSILQYYYNNFNKTSKQTNVYNNNVLQRRRNELAFLHGKAPFSSTKRPLSIRLSTPKHVVNFFSKPFRSDSQKRPLLLQNTPNLKILPKNGLKISSIYTISDNVDKFSLYRKNLYISSNSRPLFVRKWGVGSPIFVNDTFQYMWSRNISARPRISYEHFFKKKHNILNELISSWVNTRSISMENSKNPVYDWLLLGFPTLRYRNKEHCQRRS